MGYDRGDSFPLDFQPNGIPFGSQSKRKLSPRSYPIQCERKPKHSFLSVHAEKWLSVSLFDSIKSNFIGITIHITENTNQYSALD